MYFLVFMGFFLGWLGFSDEVVFCYDGVFFGNDFSMMVRIKDVVVVVGVLVVMVLCVFVGGFVSVELC